MRGSAVCRYIAIWRGVATDFELFRDFNSAQFQLEILGDKLLNLLDRDCLVVVIAHVAQHLLRELDRQWLLPVNEA